MNFKTSVIIPTFNGAKKLPQLLDSLLAQNEKHFETIVVVDGSNDNTIEALSLYVNQLPSLKIIQQENKGRAGARNAGVREAKSDILIFYDDDMEPDFRSIEKHLRFHEVHEGLVTGNQIEGQSKNDIQNYKAFLTTKWLAKYGDGLNQLSVDNLFFAAANCSMRKEHFDKLGGFDERLKDAEDFDFAYRGMEANILIYFDKTNIAIHHDFITCRGYIERQREYKKANEFLFKLHPGRAINKKRSPLKRLVYRIFAISILPDVIDKFKFFKIIPRKIRYALYGIIIHSLAMEYPKVNIK
jgi:glycosyltransferase involved in cell wall biosynthesis